jgi:hypothetical protein
VLHEIIASQSPTIQVLELFEMENNWFRMDLDVASNYWTELDNLLDDKSFSHLKEIRLLFAGFITNEELAPPQSKRKSKYPPEPWIGPPTEDTVSLFKSYALKSSEKGVRIIYGLTNGPDGLLPSNH